MKTLQQLIKEKDFDYVNSYITEENFPMPEKHEEVEYDLVHFNKNISSEDAIEELSKDGWRPATVYDLLNYDWNNSEPIVALNSVAVIRGKPHVLCLFGGDSGRLLSLGWFEDDWDSSYRFLRVRPLSSEPLEKDTLTLEKAVNFIKTLGWTITLTK